MLIIPWFQAPCYNNKQGVEVGEEAALSAMQLRNDCIRIKLKV